MTLCGLISHLRWVEYYWIEVVFLGGQDHGPWTDEAPDQEFIDGATSPWRAAGGFDEQAAVPATIAGPDLDTARRTRPRRRPPVLRWILLHLIEENARHNGHIDILREMADGVTGD